MVTRNAFRATLMTLALLAAEAASADPITFTGNVEKDFPDPTAKGSITSAVAIDSQPGQNIFQFPELTNAGFINGYAIKQVDFSYDKTTDKMYVGIDTYSIAGSAVGAGGQTMDNILTKTYGGTDPANLGGDKSFTIGFFGSNPNSSSQPGAPVFVAGVPANKSLPGDTGLDKFTVASYTTANGTGLQNSYGAVLPGSVGSLAFNPDATHPNLEFTINNFSKISPNTIDPSKPFWIQVYAGSGQDGPIGEETGQGQFFPVIPQPGEQKVPEPAAWMAWTLIAGGAAFRLRRRTAKS